MLTINRKRPISLISYAWMLALFALSFAAPQPAAAQTVEQSASGNFQISLEDGYTKYVEFEARTYEGGRTIGQMTFSDEAPIPDQDVDGTGDERLKESSGLYVKAEFDGLVVNRNIAVMSGTIRESNIISYVGQRVLLSVEDNGNDSEKPDRLTWGFYKPGERRWTPSDAELKDDPGVGMRWIATDAERKDDEGVPYPRSEEVIGCQSFPLSSYDYVDGQRWAGDINVEE